MIYIYNTHTGDNVCTTIKTCKANTSTLYKYNL